VNEVVSILLGQGPAGILAVAIIYLYREKTAADKEHAAELARVQEARRAEMEVMKDRYIVKSDSFAAQLAAIVEGVREFMRKAKRR
jgi:hypothetical protein